MQNDVIQIGCFVVSKIVFDSLIIIISVVIGGLITYLTTRTIENQKWKQQKKDKQQEQNREALALALDWIDPIDNALSQIESLTSAFIMNRITRNEFQERWPDPLNKLGSVDKAIPSRLKVLLPDDVYNGIDIVNKIHDLYIFLLKTEPSPSQVDYDLADRLRSASEQIVSIQNLSAIYKKKLIDEYRNTFR